MKTIHFALLLFLTVLASQPLVAQESAASFNVRDLEGKQYSLEDLNGKIVVLNFWFVQCKPCVMEMPELNELVQKYQNEDVVFLAFALNGKAEVERFLKKKDFSYQIVPDAQAMAEQYFVGGYPTHIIIDQTGQIVYRQMGFGPTTVGDLNRKVEMLLTVK